MEQEFAESDGWTNTRRSNFTTMNQIDSKKGGEEEEEEIKEALHRSHAFQLRTCMPANCWPGRRARAYI